MPEMSNSKHQNFGAYIKKRNLVAAHPVSDKPFTMWVAKNAVTLMICMAAFFGGLVATVVPATVFLVRETVYNQDLVDTSWWVTTTLLHVVIASAVVGVYSMVRKCVLLPQEHMLPNMNLPLFYMAILNYPVTNASQTDVVAPETLASGRAVAQTLLGYVAVLSSDNHKFAQKYPLAQFAEDFMPDSNYDHHRWCNDSDVVSELYDLGVTDDVELSKVVAQYSELRQRNDAACVVRAYVSAQLLYARNPCAFTDAKFRDFVAQASSTGELMKASPVHAGDNYPLVV